MHRTHLPSPRLSPRRERGSQKNRSLHHGQTRPPQLPIEVDSETGAWTTDALPMLYVPRHFFVNNHMGIEEVLGADAYAEILYKAGYKSAWH